MHSRERKLPAAACVLAHQTACPEYNNPATATAAGCVRSGFSCQVVMLNYALMAYHEDLAEDRLNAAQVRVHVARGNSCPAPSGQPAACLRAERRNAHPAASSLRVRNLLTCRLLLCHCHWRSQAVNSTSCQAAGLEPVL